MTMSREALNALVNAKTGQGQTVTAKPAVLAELREAEMIGPSNGITRKGSILQQRETAAMLDDLF